MRSRSCPALSPLPYSFLPSELHPGDLEQTLHHPAPSLSGSPDASIHIVDLDNGSELGDRDCECYKRYLWSPDSDDLFIAHKSPVPDAMSKVPMQGWRDRFSGGSWVLSNLD